MKKIIIILITSFLLSACNLAKHTTSCEVKLIYSSEYIQELDEYVAQVTFDYNFLSDDFNFVKVPDNLVAGDILEFTYTGEIRIASTFPGHMYLDGKILKYQFIQTDVVGVHVDDGFINFNDLKQNYNFTTEYVILNQDYRYQELDSFIGTDVFLSLKQETSLSNNKKTVVGIYAFNPR